MHRLDVLDAVTVLLPTSRERGGFAERRLERSDLPPAWNSLGWPRSTGSGEKPLPLPGVIVTGKSAGFDSPRLRRRGLRAEGHALQHRHNVGLRRLQRVRDRADDRLPELHGNRQTRAAALGDDDFVAQAVDPDVVEREVGLAAPTHRRGRPDSTAIVPVVPPLPTATAPPAGLSSSSSVNLPSSLLGWSALTNRDRALAARRVGRRGRLLAGQTPR